MNIAIVLAGGIGSRVGADIPKQFIKVKGKPILAYTLMIFQKNPNIDAIEVVCHPDWMSEVEQICHEYSITKKQWSCEGGKNFQESVMNGVFHLEGKIDEEDIVVISFGVSPLTPQEDINDSIRVCKLYGNAIAAADITLCTCVIDNEESSIQSIERETLKGFANPWSFKFGELLSVYKSAIENGILESIEPHTTSLYFAIGKRIWFSQCTSLQSKITRKEDIDIFEAILELRERNKNLR